MFCCIRRQLGGLRGSIVLLFSLLYLLVNLHFEAAVSAAGTVLVIEVDVWIYYWGTACYVRKAGPDAAPAVTISLGAFLH